MKTNFIKVKKVPDFNMDGYAARRPKGELIKDLLLPKPPRTWRTRTGGQLKTWTTTINAELDWAKVSSELA